MKAKIEDDVLSPMHKYKARASRAQDNLVWAIIFLGAALAFFLYMVSSVNPYSLFFLPVVLASMGLFTYAVIRLVERRQELHRQELSMKLAEIDAGLEDEFPLKNDNVIVGVHDISLFTFETPWHSELGFGNMSMSVTTKGSYPDQTTVISGFREFIGKERMRMVMVAAIDSLINSLPENYQLGGDRYEVVIPIPAETQEHWKEVQELMNGEAVIPVASPNDGQLGQSPTPA